MSTGLSTSLGAASHSCRRRHWKAISAQRPTKQLLPLAFPSTPSTPCDKLALMCSPPRHWANEEAAVLQRLVKIFSMAASS
jgi:hypothetical protein